MIFLNQEHALEVFTVVRMCTRVVRMCFSNDKHGFLDRERIFHQKIRTIKNRTRSDIRLISRIRVRTGFLIFDPAASAQQRTRVSRSKTAVPGDIRLISRIRVRTGFQWIGWIGFRIGTPLVGSERRGRVLLILLLLSTSANFANLPPVR